MLKDARGGAGKNWKRAGVTAATLALVTGTALSAAAGPAGAAVGHGAHPALTPGTISTVAGGVGGPGPATGVSVASGAVASFGTKLYVSDNHPDGISPSGGMVREINESTDALTTVAGTGQYGPAGLDGPAVSASLTAGSIAVDSNGNVLMPDDDYIVALAAKTGRFYGQAMTKGDLYPIAGNGKGGYTGVTGEANKAGITPRAVALDSAHNILIADANRLEVVAESTGTFYGKAMTSGHIYLLAGNGSNAINQVKNGVPATQSGVLPGDVTADSAGNVVISDPDAEVVQIVAASTGTFYGQAMTAGDIYWVAGNGIGGYAGDGGPATSAELSDPSGLTVDHSGNLLISDGGNFRVRVVAASTGTFYGQAMTAGHIYTIVGDGSTGETGAGGPATSAAIDSPGDLGFDNSGNLVIPTEGYLWVVAATSGTFYGQAMTAGDIYQVAGNNQESFSGIGSPASQSEFYQPNDTASGPDGTLAIVEYTQNRVLVDPATTGTAFGRTVRAGVLYDLAGNGTAGYTNNGRWGATAELNYPGAAWVDSAGNVLIADQHNNIVRVVPRTTGTFYGMSMKAGYIYTIAGTGTAGFSGDGGLAVHALLSSPESVSVDSAGNVLITDIGNARIRVVAEQTGTFYGQAMTAGDIYTIAGNGNYGYAGDGGPATSAEFSYPDTLTADSAGNLLITDQSNARVRVVAGSTGTFYGQAMTAGYVYTIAGHGETGSTADGVPATSAYLEVPSGSAVDPAGNVLIAEPTGVRVVAGSTGTFYGQAMTAGDIYTIAGDGQTGFSGDGGPATQAEMEDLMSVAVDSTGNIYLDDYDGRIREIAEG